MLLKFGENTSFGNCKGDEAKDCDKYHPINIGYNVWISDENYKFLMKNYSKHKKWDFKNKRKITFGGLHIVGEKVGKEDVYDLLPSN